MIRFNVCPDGGFVVVDDVARISAYAYPTSASAILASRHPKYTARTMIDAARRDVSDGLVFDHIRESSFVAHSRHLAADAQVLEEVKL